MPSRFPFLDIGGLSHLWDSLVAKFANRSEAIKSISRSGTTFTATRADNSTFTFTQQDNNTTYSAGKLLSLNGTTFSIAQHPDTRNDNQPPSWYFTNYPRLTVFEFKFANKIGIGSSAVYCTLTTIVPWTDSSGGYPVQYATVNNRLYVRTGSSASAWGSWSDAMADTTYPKAVKSITRSGTTFTATCYDNTTFTFDQQDNTSKPLDAYPVGSIYMSVNSTSPATLFGGTWERIQDMFLLAAGSSYAAGSTGGAASVTLTAAQSGIPAHKHTVGAHKHTVPQHGHGFTQPTVPKHSHTYDKANSSVTGGSHSHTLGKAGACILNIVVNAANYLIWHNSVSNVKVNKQTGYEYHSYLNGNSHGSAGERDQETTHALGGTTDTTSSHTHTLSYTSTNSSEKAATACTGGAVSDKVAFDTNNSTAFNSGSNTAANASTAHENMPPYLSVYCWKRTA